MVAMLRASSQDLTSDQTAKVLWMGDLSYWMDEAFLASLFASIGQLANVKIIRNKTTGLSEGYGFLEFATHAAAETVLRTLNGCPIPNTDQIFRLNWAAFGKTGQVEGVDHSVFVGDLAPEVTDYVLQEHFRQFFPSVRSAKVITDAVTGRSKGYGFVRFGSESERDRALTEMNGHFISNRPIRVSLATAKKQTSAPLGAGVAAAAAAAMHPSDMDPTNTTLFIGGLSGTVSEDDLKAVFARFGDIIYTKIPQGKGCGFVQFVGRAAAELALEQMNGQLLGGAPMRISWGRSSSNRGATVAAAALPFGAYPPSGYAAPAYAYDPALLAGYSAFAAPPAAAADPYLSAYYSSVAADSAAAYNAYQAVSAGATAHALAGSGFGGSGALGGLANGGASAGAQAVGGARGGLADPLAPVDISAFNLAYIARHQAALLGSHLHAA